MRHKPSYLGLLNAIAIGERRGHVVLDAWRRSTADRKLAAELETVAIREREHAAAFTKRLCELGFDLKEDSNPEFEETLAIARSGAPDDEKFRRLLGYGTDRDGDPDPLARIFADTTIDPRTGALLGRFIAEERDSERRLRAAWSRCRKADSRPLGDEEQLLTDIAERIDRLSRTLEDLKQLRR